jgi:hypothetical protein
MANSGITPFTLPINHLANLGGLPIAPGNIIAGAAAIVLDPTVGSLTRIDADSAVSATLALTAVNFRGFGAVWDVMINAVGVGAVTATFGAGFKVSATAAPTTLKRLTVSFRSDGAVWTEISRSLAV